MNRVMSAFLAVALTSLGCGLQGPYLSRRGDGVVVTALGAAGVVAGAYMMKTTTSKEQLGIESPLSAIGLALVVTGVVAMVAGVVQIARPEPAQPPRSATRAAPWPIEMRPASGDAGRRGARRSL